MYTLEDFYLFTKKQKEAWDQTFPHDSCGYLGIVEIPHAFIYDTVTSQISLEHFQKEIQNYPYYYAWKVSKLIKVTTFIDAILAFMNKIEIHDMQLEDEMFDLMISEIQPYLIHEIDPYN